MTIYYDPQQPGLPVLKWHGAIYSFVLVKTEFWLYIFWHVFCVSLCVYLLEEGTFQNFRWEAAAVMQYFMCFFLTFYIDKCFERYMMIYPAANDLMDTVVMFVHEMNVSLYQPALQKHRTAVTKYLLSCVHEYFFVITGGKMTKPSWKQLVKRGLLTKAESDMLAAYPGGRATMVLTSWALLIIRAALENDVSWQERSQQTVHIYNRHSAHIVKILKSANRIANLMGMPLPFVYFHLMNIILMFNIMVLATIPALMRTYITVVPFGIALMIYMGCREISSSLVDPFNEDPVDFPIQQFVNHTFDRTVSLLEGFMEEAVRERTVHAGRNCSEWEEDQLKRPIPLSIMYEPGSCAATECSFRWHRPTAASQIPEQIELSPYLRKSLGTIAARPTIRKMRAKPEEEQQAEPPEVAELAQETSRAEALRIDIEYLKKRAGTYA
eukprot:gnl/TRDRNA2_/TRDRNA2_176531_c0_seq2.p1 gnl/TRDRNA2_/TRDRNA2_176531_c0~~gnl/TRDRNA2_/TRDRNA2_176531_c0_seq2.p1  ORF type:complete len:439 (-),score=72.02 gnl/TRDRNA2_/TRDRNA2_176531_c0_seq2:722-2038(-)